MTLRNICLDDDLDVLVVDFHALTARTPAAPR